MSTNNSITNTDIPNMSNVDLESMKDKEEQMSEISNDKNINDEADAEIIRKMFDRMHQDNKINFKEIENNPM